MNKLILKEDISGITYEEDLPDCHPVFVKKNGKFIGMIVHEEFNGWIVRLGGKYGAYGYRDSREECIRAGVQDHGYEFFVETTCNL